MKNTNQEFDREEQRIYDAFSQIKVDKDKLKRRMEHMEKKKVKRYSKFSVAAVVAFIFVTISATGYAASGGLDMFNSRFNPAFIDLVTAPTKPSYAEDQGIRLEVIGAQQVNSVVLLYLTMQDITDENRLTRYMWPDIEFYVDGQLSRGGGSSMNRLHFDQANNTSYFEMRIVGDIGIARAKTLELVGNSINCTQFSGQVQRPVVGEWKLQVNISEPNYQVLSWENVEAVDIHIEYMSLSPLGIQMKGTHEWDAHFHRLHPRVEIELENRWFNIRPKGSSGGVGLDFFEFFFFTDAPIDVEAVTAVIINGVRVTPSSS
ncbi:MAG: hypothetical protein FWC91_08770 [Defluviitaleaceae bacterium]|nr:hypothetical protein [Defluviitaleaceae bacterium]